MSTVCCAFRRMVSRRRLLSVIALVPLLVSAAAIVWAEAPVAPMRNGATYYVATTGDDDNPGTQEQPWATIQKAADTMVAGDMVYIETGTYHESIRPRNSGNSTDGYISYVGVGEVVVDGGNAVDYGIYASQSYIRIENLTFRDAYMECIMFQGTESERLTNIQIVDSTVEGCGKRRGRWDHGLNLEHVDDFQVRGVVADNNQANGIMIINCENGLVVDSAAYYNNGPHERIVVYQDDADGIVVMNSRYVTLQDCEASYNGEEGIDLGTWGRGVKGWTERHDLAHVEVIQCTALENAYAGMAVNGEPDESDCQAYDITLANSVIYGSWREGFTGKQHAYDISLLNNTIVANGNWGINLMLETRDYVIKNNIVAFHSQHQMDEPSIAGLEVDYNTWWPDLSPQAGAHAVNADPRFMDRSGDYHLASDSPCIDAGTNVLLPSDLDGNPRPLGAGFDIGAYEYASGPQPTPSSTATPTSPPTSTPTPSPTSSPASTSTSTSTPTASPTSTSTATSTLTPTVGPTSTSTATPTSTPAIVPTMTATATANPDEIIVDNVDGGFSTSFSQDPWVEYAQPDGRHYGGSHHYNHRVGTGQDVALWSFAVPKPGRYEVYAWWWEASWRPTDVPYTVTSLSGSTTVRVNQQANGGQWNLLGTFDFQGPGSVVVSDDASSGQDIVADAVRLLYVEPLPPATPTSTATSTPTSTPVIVTTMTATPTANPDEVIVDDPDAGFSTSSSQDPWEEYVKAGGRHYGGSHYYNHQVGTGQDIALWSFAVPKPGRYEVYAWWWEAAWRPTDVPYTIKHLSGSTTIRVDQQTNGGQWNLLGVFEFQGPGSVVVSDDASSGQDIVADAVRLLYVEPLPPAPPTSTATTTPTSTPVIVATMTATPTANADEVIIDNVDGGFSTSFSQDAWVKYTQSGGRHYGDSHYYNARIGTGQDIAAWSFAVPKPGRYKVYAWWWEGRWRPRDVPYTISHLYGSSTVRVNQRVKGGRWNLLGTFDFLDRGSVAVSDDVSSGHDVVADAVRVVYQGPPRRGGRYRAFIPIIWQ